MKKLLSVGILFTLLIALSAAQALDNNNCSDALSISAGTTPFDTTDATTDGADVDGCFISEGVVVDNIPVYNDIWYEYTAPSTGGITVSLCESSYDTKLVVYDGCECDSITALKCNDDSCDVKSEVTAPVTEGNCYMIRIGGYALSKGEGEISITMTPNDSDSDGVADASDNCPSVPNSNQSDTDSDGIGDACDDDLDNDDVPNTVDNSPSVPNQDQLDTDSDGIGDVSDTDKDNDTAANVVDNCPTVSNPDQTDSDSDGIGDACDNCWIKFNTLQFDSDEDCPAMPFETDPLCGDVCESATGDSDGDGVIDAQDNCVNTPNPDQTNSDADSFGDDCDNCWNITNQNQADTDGDFVGNLCDNCQTEPNPRQHDTDTDGQGDACDEDLDGDSIINVADPDMDNDGVPNINDNCQQIPNPDQSDINFNQIGDACDVCAYVNQNSYPTVNTSRDMDYDGTGDVCDDFPDEPRPVLDDDGDTILNSVDNCRWQSNVHQTDTDGDRVGDDCDNCRTVKNKDQNDTWSAASQNNSTDCSLNAYTFTLNTYTHYTSDPVCGDACQITKCRRIISSGNYALGKNLTGSQFNSTTACGNPPSCAWEYSCIHINATGANIDGKGYTINENGQGNAYWGLYITGWYENISNLRLKNYFVLTTTSQAEIIIDPWTSSSTLKNISIGNDPGSIDVLPSTNGRWLIGQPYTGYSLPANPSGFTNISMYVAVERLSTISGEHLDLVFNYPSSLSSSYAQTLTLWRGTYIGGTDKTVSEWTNGASYGKAGTHYGLNTTSKTLWALLDDYNFGSGSTYTIFPVTGNTAPGATVAFTPASPQVTDSLVCKAYVNDSIDHYLYADWKVLNGTTVKASGTKLPFIDSVLTSFYTIPSSTVTKGEQWWCVITNVSDGLLYSNNNGFNWNDYKTIGNAPPVMTWITTNFSDPKTNYLLKCNVAGSDPDGDPIVYYFNWSNNGVTITGETSQTLDLSKTGNGNVKDLIRCGARVSDGIGNSSWSTSYFSTVTDSAAVISNMGISDTLNNVYASYSADVSDDDNVTACIIEHNNTDIFVNTSEYALDYTTSDVCSIPITNNRNGDAAIGWYVWLKDLGGKWYRSSLKTEYIVPGMIDACSNITRGDANYIVTQNLVGTQPNGACIDVQTDNVSINCGNDIVPIDKRYDDLTLGNHIDPVFVNDQYGYDETMKALSTNFLGTGSAYFLLGANYTDDDSLYAEFLFRTNNMTNHGASGLDLWGYGYLGFMNSADYTKNIVAASMYGVFKNGLTVYNQSMGAAIKSSDKNLYVASDVEFAWDGTSYIKQDINDTTWYKFIVKYNAGSRTLLTYLYDVSNGGLVGSYSISLPSDKHFTVDSVGAFGDGTYAYLGAQDRFKIPYIFANAGTDKVTKIYTDRDATNMNLRYHENGTENNYMNISSSNTTILSKFQWENDFNALYYPLDTYPVGSSLDETKDFYGRFELTTPRNFNMTSDSTTSFGTANFGFLNNVTGSAMGLNLVLNPTTAQASVNVDGIVSGSVSGLNIQTSTNYVVEVWHNSSSNYVSVRLTNADDGTIIYESYSSAPATFDYYTVGTWTDKDAAHKSRFVNDWTITKIKSTAGMLDYGTNGLTLIGSDTGTGIRVNNHDDITIKNCNIYNYSTGIELENSADSRLNNVKLLSNSIGLDTSGSTGTVVNNTRFNPTVTDFTYDGDLEISSASEDLTIQPSEKSGIYSYINILKTSTSAWMNLTMHYKDADLKYVDESTLNIYKNSSDTWTNSIGTSSGLNTTSNIVYSNISSFGSLFAALGTSVDDDRDGINNTIDASKKVYSNLFNDTSLGGKSSGTITDRGSHEVAIVDHTSSSKGVTITITGDDNTNATLNVCGGTLVYSKRNSTFDVTCASTDIETTEGYVWMSKEYGANNVIVGIPAGQSAKIDVVAEVLTVSAGIGNSEPLTAVYDGVPRMLAAGTAYPSSSADSDGDGVLDSSDNCPLVSNPAQTDTDNDGTGDACEINYCSNSITDNGESDIDCGGSCAKCTANRACNSVSDCASGLTCKNAQCTATTSDSCTNGIKDFSESGIDCGSMSSCSDCEIGFGCIIDDDCSSVYCNAGVCAVDNRAGTQYTISPKNNPYSLFISNDIHSGPSFSSKTDVYIGQAGISYILLNTDEVSGAVSNFDLSALEVQTSSSAAGDTVFVSGLVNPHATYGIYKDVLIPAGDAPFAFCCPAAQSINEVVPGCAGMFITQDKIFGGLGGTYFVCANMEGSGGSTQQDTNLTINDSAEGSSAPTNTEVTFNAYYYNKTSGAPLTDATSACTVDIDGTNYTMNYVSADARWNATHVFTSSGTVWWTVWCNTSAPGHFDLTATDSVDITSLGTGAPEFSDLAYVLAAVLGAGGFLLIRKR